MKRYTNTELKLKNSFFIKRLPFLSVFSIIMLWEALVRILKIPSYILPGPYEVGMSLFESRKIILSHTVVTSTEAILGFILSTITGLALAFVMNRWKTVKSILYPLLVISQTIPIIALAPLILIWMGVGVLPKIMVVVLVCFFPICVSTTEGLQSADPDMINLMKVMGADHLKIFREVVLPSALPQFFSGLKIAATYSIMGAVIGEWLGAKSGLGIYMTRTMSSYRTDLLFASIVVVVVTSIFLFMIIEIIEKLIIPWNRVKDIKGDDVK
ncbi:putative aliphatic sulfonates transport permease protein SsuC [Oxobacter pfennigii]|uniref:Putative aliphatic sulfonates transport permease protein SsuC n=1 Tax=Oxobacter pfennigii TaxID=36849 RepID=A0A0P9ADZ2_9CLOT|nr:ABC transporter permease [Oxobacter pfennigii]KPU43452.1 putative aliphatic sulfonates transport permease protein SsuC [Oxobacter pfennigii]